jgi:tRNA (guanine37-N1)-methyltransferase
MKIDILTIFPEMFGPILNESILKRAQEKGIVKVSIHNLRDFSSDLHRKVDDRPFGGGPGMVLRPEPIFRAVETILENPRPSPLAPRPLKKKRNTEYGIQNTNTRIILLSPQGMRLDQNLAKKISQFKHLILICGRYEGVDERVRKFLVDLEISIGDYVLTGGELPAMVLIDSIVRLIPGVLGNKDSYKQETFSRNLLEYPQYTRPSLYRGMKVPEILLSGKHKQIQQWRKMQSVKRTIKLRPDLRKDVTD